MKLDEFLAILNKQNEGQKPLRHKLGKPLKPGVLEKVRGKWKKYTIPDELVRLYQQFDGIKLACDDFSRNGLIRLLPMNGWKTVRGWWLKIDDELPGLDDGMLRDGLILTAGDEYHLVLSPDGTQYFSFIGGRHFLIGDSLDAVFDWLHDLWLVEKGGQKRFTPPVVEKEEPPQPAIPHAAPDQPDQVSVILEWSHPENETTGALRGVSPDGQVVATSFNYPNRNDLSQGPPETLCFWSTNDGSLISGFQPGEEWTLDGGTAFLAGSTRFVATLRLRSQQFPFKVVLIDTASGTVLRDVVTIDHLRGWSELRSLSDGNSFVGVRRHLSPDDDGPRYAVYDATTGDQRVLPIDIPSHTVGVVRDGAELLVSGYDGIARYDLASGEQTGLMKASSSFYFFVGNERLLCSGRGRTQIWDIGRCKRVGGEKLPAKGVDVLAVFRQPHGLQYLLGSWTNSMLDELHVWDPAGDRDVCRLPVAAGTMTARCSLPPDHRRLLTLGKGHTIRIWQMPARCSSE